MSLRNISKYRWSYIYGVDGNKASNLYTLVDFLEREPFNIKSEEQKEDILKYLKSNLESMGDSTIDTAYDVLYRELTSVNFPNDQEFEEGLNKIRNICKKFNESLLCAIH